MKHGITGVAIGSAAEAVGLREGDAICAINGEPVLDEIDYQALTAGERLTLDVEHADGTREQLILTKDEGEPLGLRFGESMTLKPRTCRNHCVFCFIDQMPPSMRETLYVKDDDWRFSLMMGNFVTLTNVDDAEFERIIRRHASPLYVSVHTTGPALRCRMMNNRFAGGIMERLRRLKDAGIRFHCQIVCCPGWNDGDALLRTLNDLRSLAPAARSAAIVPVGLTRFRDSLEQLTPFDRESAVALLDSIAPFQAECLRTLGSRFVFPSDEFFCLSGRDVPDEDWYEDFPQIENGVGLLRRFASDIAIAAEDDDAPDAPPKTLVIATGVSATPFIRRYAERYAPKGTTVRVATIINRFFGESVTVAGLLTGGDTLRQLTPELLDGADAVLISRNMLRHERDRFLDDMTLEEFTRRLGLPVRVVDDGGDFYAALHGRTEE